MLIIRDSQMNSMENAAPGRPVVLPCKATWIEIRLLDSDNQPVPGEKYRVRLPDSSIREGVLDQEGKVRFEGIAPGECQLCFPKIDGNEWRPLGNS
jgi:hypothetical protein